MQRHHISAPANPAAVTPRDLIAVVIGGPVFALGMVAFFSLGSLVLGR